MFLEIPRVELRQSCYLSRYASVSVGSRKDVYFRLLVHRYRDRWGRALQRKTAFGSGAMDHRNRELNEMVHDNALES